MTRLARSGNSSLWRNRTTTIVHFSFVAFGSCTRPCSRVSGPSLISTGTDEFCELTQKQAPCLRSLSKARNKVVGPAHLDREAAIGIRLGGIGPPRFHAAFVLRKDVGLAVADLDGKPFDPLNLRQGNAVGVPESGDVDAGGGTALRIEHAAFEPPGVSAGERGARRAAPERQPNKLVTAWRRLPNGGRLDSCFGLRTQALLGHAFSAGPASLDRVVSKRDANEMPMASWQLALLVRPLVIQR